MAGKVRLKLYQESATLFLGLGLIVMLSGWETMPILISPDKKVTAQIIGFEGLNGWDQDQHDVALITFNRSCRIMKRVQRSKRGPGFFGTYQDWAQVCARAAQVPVNNRLAAKKYFEDNFVPAQLINRGDKGLFTGYFEPEVAASLTRSARYNIPLYRKPKDLIRAKKAKLPANWNRANSAGLLRNGILQPYYTRAQIEQGALSGRDLEFVYLASPIDAFFLHIQGSGRLFLDNGSTLRVGFEGKNGRPYTAIGKILIDQGELTRENVSMQSIRDWLDAHPKKAKSLMRQNRSFIFFRPLKSINPNLGPPGAQGVPLTPQRSLAVDKELHGYGIPIWLETEIPQTPAHQPQLFHRLMVAQDTGSAIKGPVRGDIFWGSGKTAGDIAGRLKQPGKMFLLLPKPLAEKFADHRS